MSVNPVANHDPHGHAYGLSDVGALTPKQFNIGDLESDPGIRDALHTLSLSDEGVIRESLVHLGHAILSGKYSDAKDVLTNIKDDYGDTVLQPMLTLLRGLLPSDIESQIEP